MEYEGGGDETRANPWLAELQQDMFCEINPVDANNSGIRDGSMMWVESPEGGRAKVKALVTERVAPALSLCRSTLVGIGWARTFGPSILKALIHMCLAKQPTCAERTGMTR